MKQVLTGDNSVTLYNEDYKECYHSVSGAIEEAFKKYIEPCKIKDGSKILDICFGIGYNSLAAISRFKNLKIVALEKDKKVLEDIQKLEVKGLEEKYEIIKKVARDFKYKDKDYDIRILAGDARETIKNLNERFDAVFLDPFSVNKNKELWSVEFFRDIKRVIKEDGILSTYSCSSSVRLSLREAGFNIGNGPVVGRKRPCTLASLRGKLLKLTEEDERLVRAFGKVISDRDLSLENY